MGLPSGGPRDETGGLTMIMRHYPPAVLVHVPECVEGSALPAVMASVLETGFYSHRFHFCFAEAGYHLATVTAARVIRDGTVPMVSVERLDYRPHRYVPSDDQPADALHARCRVCYGTHGEDGPTRHPRSGDFPL
ncbi:hypothetical protein ODJ79_38360 [Actinoplanes sp. KI2]|uniref:hypothetical protein n=1 Tax=Actinoplanes sp. KI2 TaxID=2983315 RepID=UPI0021D5E43B|nr:hypothetical protein [Actinoplanes sp. KI2]MCU7729615.1 hypothetical protein [Actinoplanes sp. KI2]